MSSETAKNALIFKALVVSSDPQVLELVDAVTDDPGLTAEIRDHRAMGDGTPLRDAKLRLVVIDDTEIDDANRTRLLDEIRKWAPDARLLYIAGEHSPQTEAQARRSGANYYLPKPMDAALLARVLHALIRSIG